ncbi:hypothetical protein AVEN_245908-1 [Araneus ventricosus]|uniref:Uncharacterized protein n=1 Tax=Araneus ventricosus TaxID=182803 RepID=A0A4Y2VUB0_ARAVE|nr:hypothetical protein AVEN_245908-1 [Araneus ventricosus]
MNKRIFKIDVLLPFGYVLLNRVQHTTGFRLDSPVNCPNLQDVQMRREKNLVVIEKSHEFAKAGHHSRLNPSKLPIVLHYLHPLSMQRPYPDDENTWRPFTKKKKRERIISFHFALSQVEEARFRRLTDDCNSLPQKKHITDRLVSARKSSAIKSSIGDAKARKNCVLAPTCSKQMKKVFVTPFSSANAPQIILFL